LRFASVAIVLGFSYLNVRQALAIVSFERVYHDMLSGRPLPDESRFIISNRSALIALSCVLPALALGCFFLRRLSLSIYMVGSVIICLFAQLFFTSNALMLPLSSIVANMQNPQ